MVLLIRTINELTGLHIDHYAQVNLLGFYRISNAIGGVEVTFWHMAVGVEAQLAHHQGVDQLEFR